MELKWECNKFNGEKKEYFAASQQTAFRGENEYRRNSGDFKYFGITSSSQNVLLESTEWYSWNMLYSQHNKIIASLQKLCIQVETVKREERGSPCDIFTCEYEICFLQYGNIQWLFRCLIYLNTYFILHVLFFSLLPTVCYKLYTSIIRVTALRWILCSSLT